MLQKCSSYSTSSLFINFSIFFALTLTIFVGLFSVSIARAYSEDTNEFQIKPECQTVINQDPEYFDLDVCASCQEPGHSSTWYTNCFRGCIINRWPACNISSTDPAPPAGMGRGGGNPGSPDGAPSGPYTPPTAPPLPTDDTCQQCLTGCQNNTPEDNPNWCQGCAEEQCRLLNKCTQEQLKRLGACSSDDQLALNPFSQFNPIDGGFGSGVSNLNVTGFLQDVMTYGSVVLGGLAVLKIIFGGVMYATAAGNAQRISDAKSHIFYALLGVALIAGSNIILWLFGATNNIPSP